MQEIRKILLNLVKTFLYDSKVIYSLHILWNIMTIHEENDTYLQTEYSRLFYNDMI